MKSIIGLLLALAPFFLTAQDSSKFKQTKYEKFSSEDGVLKKLETHKLGKLRGFTMYKKTTTNVESGVFYNAVEITERTDGWTGKGGGTIIFDEDELPSIVKTLKYFLNNVMRDDCRDECPTYIYETYGGVYIFSTKGAIGYGNSWRVFIGRSLSGITVGTIDLDNKDLSNFIKLLETYR